MPKISNRLDLDMLFNQGCSEPNCDHRHADEPMYLTPVCHAEEYRRNEIGLEARYYRGRLEILCAKCQRLVVAVEVK